MKNSVRRIDLDNEDDLLDSQFEELIEDDHYTRAEFKIVERVYIEYPNDSAEALALRANLTNDLQGKRILIYRTDNEVPFRISQKSSREER